MLSFAKEFFSVQKLSFFSREVSLSQRLILDILTNFEQHNWYLVGDQLHILFKGETIVLSKSGIATLRFKNDLLKLNHKNTEIFQNKLLQLT